MVEMELRDVNFESHKKDGSRLVEPVTYLVEVVDLVHFETLWEHSSGNRDVDHGDAAGALGLATHELPDHD